MERTSINEEHMLTYLKGNQYAIKWVMDMYRAIHLWDDLIDRDGEVGDAQINKVMFALMLEAPCNPFYLEFCDQLAPMLRAMVTDWMDSVHMERNMGEDGKAYAYGLRASFSNIVIQCAYLLGGYDHMRAVSKEIRKAVLQCESYDEYLEELTREQDDREHRSMNNA